MVKTKRFKLQLTPDYIKNTSLAEYATPYPLKQADESRQIPETACRYRNAFERDRDRIIHSKSFRKLQGKTQVFVAGINPTIRNRLTHTLEVWQIATSLARTFRVNTDLVEAIALGHDIGHTPFGHSGEGELGKILEEKTNRGFNHNEQSVVVACFLEESPKSIKSTPIIPVGLNLTEHTIEGIYRHTPSRVKDGCQDERICDRFTETSFGSIEAQIVHIADDIAQNTHDLADLWTTKILGYQHLLDLIMTYPMYFGYETDDAEDLDRMYDKFMKDGFTREFSSYLVGTLVNDVRETSIDELNKKYNGSPESHQFIKYAKDTEKFVEEIKNLTKLKGINSDEVSQTNSRGRHIIRSLYELFRDDAHCLPLVHKNGLSKAIQKKINDTKKYPRTNITQNEDIRIICDYIASLTDQEAIERFRTILT
ncbi:MAG: dNTP triphosphohydrolase [Methanoregula sp.]